MIVLPFSIIVALVGLIESLLTLSVLDEMDGKRGRGNQECIAQGTGNIVCGFLRWNGRLYNDWTINH